MKINKIRRMYRRAAGRDLSRPYDSKGWQDCTIAIGEKQAITPAGMLS
jgi:hypothetical protein